MISVEQEVKDLRKVSAIDLENVLENLMWLDENIGSVINGVNIRDLMCEVEDVQVMVNGIANDLEGR